MVSKPAVCSVPNCKNNRGKSAHFSMFRVPNDPVRSKEWITNSGRKDLLLKDTNYLYHNIRFCSAHFEDSQFMNSNRNKLVWNAVPTIFSKASKVDDQTESNRHQTPGNSFETKKAASPTDKVFKISCLSKNNSLNSTSKPTILKRKYVVIEKTKFLKNKRLKLKMDCKSSNNFIEPKALNSSDGAQQKLCTSEIILNDSLSQYKKEEMLQRKFSKNRSKSPSTLKPIIVKRKVVTVEENEFHSSPEHIHNEGIKNTSRKVDMQNKSSLQKAECHSSVQLVKANDDKGPLSKVDPINIFQQKNVNQSLLISCGAKTMGSVNPTDPSDKVNPKAKPSQKTGTQSVLKHGEAIVSPTNPSNKVDPKVKHPQKSGNQSLLRHSGVKTIVNPTDKEDLHLVPTPRIVNCRSLATPIETNTSDEEEVQEINYLFKNNEFENDEVQKVNYLIENDELLEYKMKAEAFRRKLCLPTNNTSNRTFKPIMKDLEPLKKGECRSLLKHRLVEVEDINNPNHNFDVQPKSVSQITEPHSLANNMETNPTVREDLTKKLGPQQSECHSAIKLIESQRISNATDKTQIRLCSPENNSFSSGTSKCKQQVEAYEKIIDGLKAQHKSQLKTLKKVIKELKRRNRRKDFMIRKLRKEKNDLKNCTYYVKSQSKANFQRDRYFIEQTLSKYVSKDALHIIMNQMKKPASGYGNRWDDETKLFALNILQSSSKAYEILRSYLQLPTIRTLQKFVQGADLMAVSGLNHDFSSDVEKDNECSTVPGNSSGIKPGNLIITEPVIISSVVEVGCEDINDSDNISSVVEVVTENQETSPVYEIVSEETLHEVALSHAAGKENTIVIETDQGTFPVFEIESEVTLNCETTLSNPSGKENSDTTDNKEVIYLEWH